MENPSFFIENWPIFAFNMALVCLVLMVGEAVWPLLSTACKRWHTRTVQGWGEVISLFRSHHQPQNQGENNE